MKVLVIEDDREISKVLSSYLEEQGYEIQCAYDGLQATKSLKKQDYQIVLMDLMLPYKGGEYLIKELREYSDTPVIVLSAKSMMETRLEMLRIGADDYILKPFNLDEVLVRMEVVLRRSAKPQVEENNLQCGDLIMDLERNHVTYQNQEITLTAKEFQLLRIFLENPEKTFTKANLYESVWNDVYYYEDNTINVHMSNLRNKLKKITKTEYIETVWGIGYRIKQKPE